MTHCDEYVELISAALDGALSPEEQARLEAHLAQCPDCRTLYEDLSKLRQALRELPPMEIPAGLTERIMHAGAAEAAETKVVPLPAKKPVSLRWRKWAATAAVLALILAGGWGMSRTGMVRNAKILPAALPESQDISPYAAQAESPEGQDVFSLDPDQTESAEYSGDPEGQALGTDEEPLLSNGITADMSSQSSPSPAGSTGPAPEGPRFKQTGPTAAPTPQPSEVLSPEFSPEESQEVGIQITSFRSAPPPPPEAEPPSRSDGAEETAPPPPSNGLLDNVLPESVPGDNQIGLVSVDDEPEETLPLTPQEAMALVVIRCFGDSGYEMVREDLEGEPLSCHVSLLDGEAFIAGGTIVYVEELEGLYYFECHWDDAPEHPYHYSVHKIEGYVAWQGEVLGNEP